VGCIPGLGMIAPAVVALAAALRTANGVWDPDLEGLLEAARPVLTRLLRPVVIVGLNRLIPSTTATDRVALLDRMLLDLRCTLTRSDIQELRETLSDIQELRESSSSANMEKLMERVLKPRLKGLLGPGASGSAVRPAVAVLVPDKYVAADKQIRLGRPEDATRGLQIFMGVSDAMMGQFYSDPIGSIRREFEKVGGMHKANFDQVCSGTFGDGKSLESLVAHPNAKMAKLKTQHVLALRIYTTSSFSCVNDPLRQDPPQRPHPFAATTHFCDQGIRMLRTVAASLPDAHSSRVYWRGMRDLGLTMEFLDKGGTEFACLSTSASQEVAVNFAASTLPLIFKFETKDFTSRGADIGWLSVYPNEKEAL
jgi:hypothetical protein